MSGLSKEAREYIRQQGREWARNNPDPVRDAEVTRLLRQLRPRTTSGQQTGEKDDCP